MADAEALGLPPSAYRVAIPGTRADMTPFPEPLNSDLIDGQSTPYLTVGLSFLCFHVVGWLAKA